MEGAWEVGSVIKISERNPERKDFSDSGFIASGSREGWGTEYDVFLPYLTIELLCQIIPENLQKPR